MARLKQWQIDMREGTEDKFWRNIQKLPSIHGECWIWTGHKNSNHNGKDCEKYFYGQFTLTDKNWNPVPGMTKMAHRLALYFTHGRPVPDDLDVFPGVCSNHLCINPAHLWIRNKANTFRIAAADFFAGGDDAIEMARAA